MQNRIGLNSFQIKLIALVLMVVDHCGLYFFPQVVLLRWVGRIAAPLFLFCAVHSIDYTRNKRKYVLRLYFFAILLEGIWAVLVGYFRAYDRYFYMTGNIFYTLFVVVAIICILQKMKLRYAIPLIAIWQVCSCLLTIWLTKFDMDSRVCAAMVVLTGNMFFCEYGIWWIILGVVLYYVKKNKKSLAIGYSIVCLAMWFQTALAFFARVAFRIWKVYPKLGSVADMVCKLFTKEIPDFNPIEPHGLYLGDDQWLMIFSLPIMLLYNGEKGKSWKYFFYIFYPLHIVLLFCISRL